MKFSFLTTASIVVGSTNAFVAPVSRRTSRIQSFPAVAIKETADKVEEGNVYDKIGIGKDDLALGVDPDDFYEFIGTRESLVEKTMADLSMSREKAEAAVDKYLLDMEMVNVHIEYSKLKAEDPDFSIPKPKEDGPFNFNTIVTGYLVYLGINTFIVPRVRDSLIEKDYHSDVEFIENWIRAVPPATADAVSDTSQTISAVAQTISDAS